MRQSQKAQAVLKRVEALDWGALTRSLHEHGHVRVGRLLSPGECSALSDLYAEDEFFRSRVLMKRHGFGSGEYKYLKYELPPVVSGLRRALYDGLRRVANDWHERMRFESRFPERFEDYIRVCHEAGQTRPTPLILSYERGDYNCLHQDLYGEHVFPIQAAILLSRPGEDFTGGEFVMTEQRPRMQSRVTVAPLDQGDALLFAVCDRPVHGVRGTYRVKQRHGVSAVRSGRRRTLGIIFHDAR